MVAVCWAFSSDGNRLRDTREVYLVSGDGSIGPAGECYITDVESGMRIGMSQQVNDWASHRRTT